MLMRVDADFNVFDIGILEIVFFVLFFFYSYSLPSSEYHKC